jgi:cell division septation protein DedD
VAQHIQDEGFHEIQLNGKQLVFLFMAATVVSVVIFLCGVLVGRGVKSQLGTGGDNAAVSTVAETTPTQPAVPAAAPAAGSDPTTAAPPPPAADDLSYFNRLEKSNAPAEQLKATGDRGAGNTERRAAPAAASPTTHTPAPPPSVKEPPPVKEPASTLAPPPAPAPVAAAAPAASASTEPGGQGFAVQIAALNLRSEADAIAKRLSSKGYAAYVLTPANGSPSVFRVRVGKFNTRREAETVAARLQKEEQFKPWVTR